MVKVFSNEARSATTDQPAFLEMIKTAKAGLFDVLSIHKLDRFARDRYDSAFYKRELRGRCTPRERCFRQSKS
ncbi:MAG: recombinase family protein [Desulfomicrobium sp.]|nr:recombinase family protein [Desulfomicrobium sp.]